MQVGGSCRHSDIGPGRWLVALVLVSAAHAVAVEWLMSRHGASKPPSTMLAIEAMLLAPSPQPVTNGSERGGEPAGTEAAEPAPQEEPPVAVEPERETPAEREPEPVQAAEPQPAPEPEPDPTPSRVTRPVVSPATSRPKAGREPPPKTKAGAGPVHLGDATDSSADAAAGPARGGATTGPRYDAAYLSNPPPPYPAAARRRNVQGRVLVYAVVAPNGACARAEIRQSSGHPILDEAALEAVRAWRFVPATRDGSPVAAGVEIPIFFRLEG
jgi:protein TonB